MDVLLPLIGEERSLFTAACQASAQGGYAVNLEFKWSSYH